jgi:hypothetical protein
VAADVLLTGIATAVAIKTGHGLERTEFKPLTEDVKRGFFPVRFVSSVISQHNGLRPKYVRAVRAC